LIHWIIGSIARDQWINEEMNHLELDLANAGVEYMAKSRFDPCPHPKNDARTLADFVAIYLRSWGECRKDYITLAVNQRALWSVIAPAVHGTVLDCLFNTCHPLFLTLVE